MLTPLCTLFGHFFICCKEMKPPPKLMESLKLIKLEIEDINGYLPQQHQTETWTFIDLIAKLVVDANTARLFKGDTFLNGFVR